MTQVLSLSITQIILYHKTFVPDLSLQSSVVGLMCELSQDFIMIKPPRHRVIPQTVTKTTICPPNNAPVSVHRDRTDTSASVPPPPPPPPSL